MSRATKFIHLYNELAHHLSTETESDSHTPYSRLVDHAARKSALIRRWRIRLKEFGDLRNAIVHHRNYPEEILAEPIAKVVREFELMVNEIRSPKRLIPTFQREVTCFEPDDKLELILTHMRDRDYSQAVVSRREGMALVTTEGIARWLEDQMEDDTISLKNATASQVLRFESNLNHLIMKRDDTVHDAEEAFSASPAHGRPHPFAIVVTHNGSPHEKPLGIVTPWDLMGLESIEFAGEGRAV